MIGILGGAFDPPHIGHAEIALAALGHVDTLWIQPCYAHKYNKKMTGADLRLHMCDLLVDTINTQSTVRFAQLSNFEIKHQLTCGSLRVLEVMEDYYHHPEICMVMGQDNAESISGWERWQELIERPCVVVARPGCEPKNTWYMEPPHTFIDCVCEDVSSTQIRGAIKSGLDDATIKHFVPQPILDFIREHKLYGAEWPLKAPEGRIMEVRHQLLLSHDEAEALLTCLKSLTFAIEAEMKLSEDDTRSLHDIQEKLSNVLGW